MILSLHLKQEMLYAPIATDRDFVTRLTAAVPIELIVQHGPHVVQPVERVNASLVYWSVGPSLTTPSRSASTASAAISTSRRRGRRRGTRR